MTRKKEMNDTANDGLATERSGLTRRAILLTGTVGAGISLAGCLDRATTLGQASSTTEADDNVVLDVGLDARESVVQIETGTGWIVEENIVLTCSHVVGNGTIDVELFDGRTVEGDVLDRHEELDLAVVEGPFDEFAPLSIDADRTLDSNADVPLVQVGHPKAVGSWVISTGRFERPWESGFLADLPCGPGSSGSPLLTLDGLVVGTAIGTTVSVEEQRDENKPDDVFTEFPGQRLLARAVGPDAIEECLDHLL